MEVVAQRMRADPNRRADIYYVLIRTWRHATHINRPQPAPRPPVGQETTPALRAMRLAQIAIRTGKHDNVPVGIADPDFLVTGVRVHMRLDDDARAERAGVCDGAIKAIGFEPEQDAMTGGAAFGSPRLGWS